jgi:protein gp37
MAAKSAIEWTESTWNPVTGCSKISAGCKNCYAERMSRRLRAMGQHTYVHGFEVSLHEDVLNRPTTWKSSHIIFVNSMSDLFHNKVPVAFIHRIFNVMNNANEHIYQILTKRSGRLRKLNSRLSWNSNIWMGVSVESNKYLYRIDDLRQTNAFLKFVSFEPLLAPAGKVNLKGIDWVIVGGESGPGARPMDPAWVLEIRDQCTNRKIPFFFKQWGGFNKKRAGRLLEGQTWDQMPLMTR